MTLDELAIGQTAVILEVGGEGALRRRLLDMGLTPRTRVMVRKIAPMGDPIELYLRGYELTLRKEDAQKITITQEVEVHDIRAGRQSKLRQDHAVQPTDGQQPACGQFSGRHGRPQGGRPEEARGRHHR